MQTITITMPVCIYGVSLKAIKLEQCMRNAGFDNIVFLDRNPSNVAFDVDVMKPEEYPRETASKTMVIVMVMNVYSHAEIARNLYDLGFRYILYKSNLYCEDANGKIFDVFNDCLYFEDGHTRIGQVIGKTIDLIDGMVENKLSPVISRDEYDVIAYIPAEILYSMSEKDYEAIHPNKKWLKIPYDRCSLYYLICGELFQSFENGVDLDFWPVYNDLNRDRMFFSEESFEEEYKRHLKQRYEIYVHMSEMFYKDYDFFIRNPVMVQWNSELKVFNIIDGNNRTAFLLAKGVYFIPCKMTVQDCQAWENKYETERFLNTNIDWKSNIKYPISNPYFCMYDTGSGLYARKFLHVLMQKLLKTNFEIAGCRMLDAMSDNGFFAYCFSKSGAEVHWLSENVTERDYCSDVCAIMYAEEVKVVSWDEVGRTVYDLVVLSVDKMMRNAVKKIQSKIIILEFEEDEQINSITEKLALDVYDIIDGLFVDGKVKKIALFR